MQHVNQTFISSFLFVLLISQRPITNKNEGLETEQNDNVDFDWLEEGLERPDFNDDVFGAFTRTEGNGVGEIAAPQRSNVATIEAPQGSNVAAIEAPQGNNAAGNNSPQMDNAWEIDGVDENDWLEPPADDNNQSPHCHFAQFLSLHFC